MSQFIETEVYAAKVKDKDILLKSSSGGMFTVLSDYFLSRSYAIACCIYDYEDYQVKLQLIESVEDRDRARGSKYIHSNPGEVFVQCYRYLKSNLNKKLLFIGTGCTAAGFQRYADAMNVRDRVTIVDLICHGGVSPEIWKKYIQMVEEKNGGTISNLSFKDKRNGWKQPPAVVDICGNEVLLAEYMRLFYSQCALRPACHKCPYATVRRTVDMTIGDFWHVEDTLPDFFNPLGVSLVIVHTASGKTLFEAISDKIQIKKSDMMSCLQPNLIAPTPMSQEREKFWKEYYDFGIEYIVKKYGRITLYRRVKRKLGKIVRKMIQLLRRTANRS